MTAALERVNYLDGKHAADISYLMNCYASDPMGGGSPLSTEITSRLATELSKIPHAFSVICYVSGKPAGLINCFEAFSTFKCKPIVNVHDIIVVEEFRGQGISHLLLQDIENIAAEKDCCKITLEVLEGNIPAKNSYIKFGFKDYELDPTFGKAMFWEKEL
ncbi:MAG: ribosomal protein S18 acetylase RimI-like enzyme [Kiritimatiellia bacterium]|jgi:ribosomal protein S18 acetylase RimI-like enzyme